MTMRIHELNSETSYILDSVAPRMSAVEANLLKERYSSSSRKRHRFCFHQNPSVDLHDIVICYDRTTYIPPNKHTGKVESLLVLAGTLDFYLFNDSGQVYDYRRISASESEYPFYLRVPPNTWHGLKAVSPTPCIVKETIAGPYDKSTLQWGAFAPHESEGSEAGFRWYAGIDKERVSRKINPPAEEIYERVDQTLFRSSRQLVTVSHSQLKPIVEAAKSAPLKRARLCCHSGQEEKLQEMFIALTREVNIDESVHLRKDESLTVIEGLASYLFYNEDGSTRETISLAPYSEKIGSQDNFFARINRYLSHKISVDSDILVIHEATTGPFLKSDTDYRIRGIDT